MCVRKKGDQQQPEVLRKIGDPRRNPIPNFEMEPGLGPTLKDFLHSPARFGNDSETFRADFFTPNYLPRFFLSGTFANLQAVKATV